MFITAVYYSNYEIDLKLYLFNNIDRFMKTFFNSIDVPFM